MNEFGTQLAAGDDTGMVIVAPAAGGNPAQLYDAESGLGTAHNGAVSRLAWAHPAHGMLATSGLDGVVRLWREIKAQSWQCVYRYQVTSNASGLAFAPREYGLILAIASIDGSVTLCEYVSTKGDWAETKISAHDGAVTSVSWAAATHPQLLKAESVDIASDQKQETTIVQRFVTSSADGKVKIWALTTGGEYECVSDLTAEGKFDGAVSDVAWSRATGNMADYVAAVSEDETVQVWKSDLQQPLSSNN